MADELNAPELYRKYRPQKFSEILGQPESIKMLVEMGKQNKIPHCILFSGPSGCGKTTLARILQSKLKCHDADFKELNCADFRGIDMVRDIRSRMNMSPIGGGETRIWLIDESAKLTNDAQNALLKILEEPPDHCYFFLATTDPQKLLTTIKTRLTTIQLKPLDRKTMRLLLDNVAGAEQISITEDVYDKIIEMAEGSPRKALVLLNQVVGLENEEDQLAVVAVGDASPAAIEIARGLMKGISWSEMSKVLKGVDEDVESIRYMILGYFSQVLLGGGKFAKQAFDIIDVFSDNFYDSKRAGLIAACYEVLVGTG